MIRDKILIMILVTPFFLVMSACNPVSENVDDPLWDAQHNEKPFQSNFFHSADYRFPHDACDEPQCHGVSLMGGNSGAPSCVKCHDEQWTVFESGVHTTNISGYYHSIHVDDAVATNSNASWYTTCATALCHGTTLDGSQPIPAANAQYRYSCKECHSGFTGSIPPPRHSKKRDGAWHSTGSCSGAACHGADGESGGSAATAITGVAGHGPACDQCHD